MANPPTAAVDTALAEGFVFGGDNSTPPLAKEQKEVQHERGVEKKNRFNRYKQPLSPPVDERNSHSHARFLKTDMTVFYRFCLFTLLLQKKTSPSERANAAEGAQTFPSFQRKSNWD